MRQRDSGRDINTAQQEPRGQTHTYRQTYRHADRHTDWMTEIHTYRHTSRQPDNVIQTGRQT